MGTHLLVVALCLLAAVAIEARHIAKRQAYPYYNTPRYVTPRSPYYVTPRYINYNTPRYPYYNTPRYNTPRYVTPRSPYYVTPRYINYNTPRYNNFNSNVDCSRGGPVVDPQDCSCFYQCPRDGGAPVRMACLPGLEFDKNANQGRGACAFPGLIDRNRADNRCTSTFKRNLRADLQNICKPPQGANLSEAFTVAHPTLCNAFYMCSPDYVHAPCVMCPERMFFRSGGHQCEPFTGNVPQDTRYPRYDAQVVCPDNTQRRYVAHDDKTTAVMGSECRIE